MLPDVQLRVVVEEFQVLGGSNSNATLLFGTVVASGTKLVEVADGKADEVIPYVSTHDTAESVPLLKQTVPIAVEEHNQQ